MSSPDTDVDKLYVLLPQVTERQLRFGLTDDGLKLRIIWWNFRKDFELCSIQVPLNLFALVTANTPHPTFSNVAPKDIAPSFVPEDSHCYVTIGGVPGNEKDMVFLFKLLEKAARETNPKDGVYGSLKPFNNLLQAFYYCRMLEELGVFPLWREWNILVNTWLLCGVPYTGPEIVDIWRYHAPEDDFTTLYHSNIAYKFHTCGLRILANPDDMNDYQRIYYSMMIVAEQAVNRTRVQNPREWAHLVEENNWHLQDFERRLREKTQDLVPLARQFHPDGRLPGTYFSLGPT